MAVPSSSQVSEAKTWSDMISVDDTKISDILKSLKLKKDCRRYRALDLSVSWRVAIVGLWGAGTVGGRCLGEGATLGGAHSL